MYQDNSTPLPSEIVDWDPQVISLNTNGFSNSFRYILRQLASTHDVSFIQETRFRTPSRQEKVAYHWHRITNHEGVIIFEPPLYPSESTSPATGGLATLIHPHSPLRGAQEVPHNSSVLQGRYLQVQCTLGPTTLVLHNIYAPASSSERAAFFNALPRSFPPHVVHVVGGDFNCILNKDLDSLHPTTAVMAGSFELQSWLHSLSLVDLYRHKNPLGRTFTSPKLINRLDYIFCSTTLARLDHWHASHLPHIPNADHVACQVTTKRTNGRHGSGSWKAPPWLLRLPQAAKIIHGCLDRFLEKSPQFKNIGLAYDTMVRDIRQGLKTLHAEHLEKQQQPLKEKTLEMASLLQLPNVREDTVLLGRIRTLQQQIHEIHEQSKAFRREQAFQLHLHKAERSSKFHFASPVPAPLKKTVFKELETSEGILVRDQRSISNTLVSYYSSLFAFPEERRSDEAMKEFLAPLTRHKQLSMCAKSEISAPLLANEFYHAIKHSSTNSAPGPNALPFEALKLAPHKWSLVLELLFAFQLHSFPTLTPMQLVSTLVLLHKKGPKSQAKNYRPISLLNVDVKILTGILANRLQRHVRSIIHSDQQGFIRGRNIQTNIQRLDDMLHYMKLHSPQSMVALLDFEKAFDRVDHSYLLQVLQSYGFPPAFVDIVRVIYSGRRSKILVNGYLSSSFRINRGVLQGDPLSPLLFVIALEPMCQLLRQNSKYGIQTGDRLHTGSYFADDSQLYAGNEKCLQRQLHLVQSFCDVSGFRLNVDKTQILTYATLSASLDPWKVKPEEPAKSLGILVAPDLSPLSRFNHVFEKFQTRLSLWRYKARTLAGKVAILHSVCLPVMWYQLSFVPADKTLASKIDKVMLQFIHDEDINPSATANGLRLIKKDIVFAHTSQGGLGLTHSWDRWRQHNRAVAVRCIKAFATSPTRHQVPSWIMPGFCLLKRAFHPWGTPQDLLHADMNSSFIKQLAKNPNMTPMWSSMLSCWAEVRWTPVGLPTTASACEGPLWHNNYLPGLENLYNGFSTTLQWQFLTLASLKITKLSHVLTPDFQVWPASCIWAKIKPECRRLNLVCPSRQCITALVSRLSMCFEVVSVEEAPEFHLPQENSSWTMDSWLICPGKFPHLLESGTSKCAKLVVQPACDQDLIPTKHLNLPADFYQDPKRLRGLYQLRQPKHILPRYGEFIYKTLLRAHAMQYLFKFRDPPAWCIYCGQNETYHHFLFTCGYGQAVWHYFKRIHRVLDCSFPSNAVELFFDLPKPRDKYYSRGFLRIWPIVRACVYYQVWLQRADRTFRPDLRFMNPTETALKAASLIKLHLHHLLEDLTIKKGYSKVFNVLKKLSEDKWMHDHVVPSSVH
jgi:exonuclease III